MITAKRYVVYRCDQRLTHPTFNDGVVGAVRDQCSSCKRDVWIVPKNAAGRVVICWDCAEPTP